MNVYITGIAGMIGSALAGYHMAQGDAVYGCDFTEAPGDRIPRIDIRNHAALYQHMSDCPHIDTVYHCAAMLGVQNTEQNPEMCMSINAVGTASVVYAAQRCNVSQLVNLSSSEIYGEGSRQSVFTETSPRAGTNVYAKSKIIGENIVRKSSIPSHSFRMFNCYGPNQVRQFFIPKIMALALEDKPISIYGDSETTRTFLYADDAAVLIARLARNRVTPHVVNIGNTDKPASLSAIADTVVVLTKSLSRVSVVTDTYDDREVERDIKYRTADLTLMRHLTNYTPLSHYGGLKKLLSNFSHTKAAWGYTMDEKG